jgi:hypothetical protein
VAHLEVAAGARRLAGLVGSDLEGSTVGYVEVERFALVREVDGTEFARRDAALQAWSYLHRPGLTRRTTALGEDGSVLVLTFFSDAMRPAPASPDAPGAEPLASFTEAVDAASYRRAVYRDLG